MFSFKFYFYSRYFFYEETEESKVTRNIGNVTADTEITFEFGVRTKPKGKHKYNKSYQYIKNTI